MKRRIFLLAVVAVACGFFALAVPTQAADYPRKPITVICPWTAGGGTDVLLRALSKEAEKCFGQTINVVNQTGGGGAVGHNAIRAGRTRRLHRRHDHLRAQLASAPGPGAVHLEGL